MAFDVPGAVLAIGRLELEGADLAGQAAALLLNGLLLTVDEAAVAFPYAVAPVEDAPLLGLVLAVLWWQRRGLLLGGFDADGLGKLGQPIGVSVELLPYLAVALAAVLHSSAWVGRVEGGEVGELQMHPVGVAEPARVGMQRVQG
jgi:hypothetical protein